MLSIFLRPMPTKPWPVVRILRPLKTSSISSQWLKETSIASAVSGSQWRIDCMVASEKTTPQPNVSKARLRSTTVIWCSGCWRFIRSAK
jgi:hypothetical protein